MAETEIPAPASVEEIQRGWNDLALKVRELEVEAGGLEQENKTLRSLLERVIEHRQKSHTELVLLITDLVSRLSINDVGILVSKLVEHNNNVSQMLAGFVKGTMDAVLPEPALLKALDQTKRDLRAALKPLVEELAALEAPLEKELLHSLPEQPELFFTPRAIRANRCYLKGQLTRERIVNEYGEPALIFLNDLTTDPKLNPKPKAEEIVLAFKSDFETLFQQQATLIPDKREALMGLYQKVQRSKAATAHAQSQRNAFQKLSFVLELLHYYDNQSTEAPDAVFAQRLPGLIEQLSLSSAQENLEESLILQAERLLAFVIRAEHRLMIVNNVGKGGGAGTTLRFVLRLRAENPPDPQLIREFVKHLMPAAPQKAPAPSALTAILRLLSIDAQRSTLKAVLVCDRLRKTDAEALAKAVGTELGVQGVEEAVQAQVLPPEIERKQAWSRIQEVIGRRGDATGIAAAIRERLNAHYDTEELRQSWLTLIEAEPMTLIRIFCQVPYLANGKTDAIARSVIETYVTRLTHEKYAATYNKVMNSLKTMFVAKPDSPTLLNFLALVRWVSPEAADKLSAEIGMLAPAIKG
jgi:hypothetical protein